MWQQIPLPCAKPIEYALGVIDPRFGLSEADFLKTVVTAEQPWENAMGKELFHYNPQALFKVNLLFDERQERTLEQKKLEASLSQTKTTQETLEQKQRKTLALYEAERKEYERMVTSFKKRLDAYNADVEKWNAVGGAPKKEFEDLQRVASALEKSQRELQKKQEQVNTLVTAVNAFSDQKVALVSDYNDQVEGYVSRYGESSEFDQGEYVGQEIHIYQYDDMAHLHAVLVHEFGHTLGLIHGTNPASVMYHLMKEQSLDPLILTEEDQSLLKAQCHITPWDILLERMSMVKERIWL